MTRVLVTDAGRGSGLSVIRSLGRSGIEVVAADASRRSPAFISRYTSHKIVYPAPEQSGAAVIETLVGAAVKYAVDLVVPVGETLVVLVSDARDRFPRSTALALADADALALVRDKRATMDLAARVGVPTPGTVLVESVAEAERATAGLGWPLVLKPQMSRVLRAGGHVEAFGVEYAADRADLLRRIARFEGRCGVLLQEYCRGEGHGVGMLVDHGRPVLAFQHRRLREVPVTGGPSSFRESVPLDPVLLHYSTRILGELEWTGPAMVEFKVGPDGGARLMEVNGRLWGSLALALKSGVDLPRRMVDLYLKRGGEPPPADFTYRPGVRSRDVRLELAWIASVLSRSTPYSFLEVPDRRDALAAGLRLLDPRDGFDVFTSDDLLPGLGELGSLALQAPGRLLRRLRATRRRPAASA